MLTVTEITSAAAWNRALLELPAPHILQSWAWGETKAQTGWTARRLLWQNDDRPVAAAALLVRWLALGPVRLPSAVAYVPKGPLLDWTDAALREAVLARIEAEARRARAIFVKIDPDVCADSGPGPAVIAALTNRGWGASAEQIQFRNTVISDLRPDEDALLAGMKPKWRYNIRLAERKGIVVRDGTVADLPTFYAMYVETGRRDGFLVRPYDYYRQIWEDFLEQGLAHLLLAECPGSAAGSADAVAGIILFRFGPTAWYFYGASTAHARPLMPNYALQWAAMRWARAAHCTRYDWWGAPDLLDESDSMWGVFRFKTGFGGEFTQGIGAYDYATSPSLHWLYSIAMPRVLDFARNRHRSAAPPAVDAADEVTREE